MDEMNVFLKEFSWHVKIAISAILAVFIISSFF